jgi:hypothetical protein
MIYNHKNIRNFLFLIIKSYLFFYFSDVFSHDKNILRIKKFLPKGRKIKPSHTYNVIRSEDMQKFFQKIQKIEKTEEKKRILSIINNPDKISPYLIKIIYQINRKILPILELSVNSLYSDDYNRTILLFFDHPKFSLEDKLKIVKFYGTPYCFHYYKFRGLQKKNKKILGKYYLGKGEIKNEIYLLKYWFQKIKKIDQFREMVRFHFLTLLYVGEDVDTIYMNLTGGTVNVLQMLYQFIIKYPLSL